MALKKQNKLGNHWTIGALSRTFNWKWRPVRATSLDQATASFPGTGTENPQPWLPIPSSNSTSLTFTTQIAPTRPSFASPFTPAAWAGNRLPQTPAVAALPQELRRRCRSTFRTGRRSWERSTGRIEGGTASSTTTARARATMVSTEVEGGCLRMSFWRGRGWLRSRCRKASGGLWRGGISAGSEMRFGPKPGSKTSSVGYNRTRIFSILISICGFSFLFWVVTSQYY